MTATFHSLRDTRLPKAQKAVSLLKNLVRYDPTEQEAKDIVHAVSDAADDLDAVFAKKWGWQEDDMQDVRRENLSMAIGRTIPAGTAEGGSSFEAEVHYALDAVMRGDCELAKNRLKRILNGEPHVET